MPFVSSGAAHFARILGILICSEDETHLICLSRVAIMQATLDMYIMCEEHSRINLNLSHIDVYNQFSCGIY